jgi:hypothetical protein
MPHAVVVEASTEAAVEVISITAPSIASRIIVQPTILATFHRDQNPWSLYPQLYQASGFSFQDFDDVWACAYQ